MTTYNDSQSPPQEQPSPTDLKRAITSGTFISKLWIMLNDSSNNHLIRWSVDGHAICIPDVAAFSKEILPQYFKHNNWSSFIRQLNLYEFRRVNVSEPTGGSDPRQTYFFMNDDFQRGQSDRLSRIKRQSTTHKTASSSSTTTTGETTSSQGGRRRGSNEPEHDHHHYCFLNEEGTCAAESKMTQLHDLVVETEKKCNYLSKEAENLRMIYNKQQELLSTLLDSVRTMTTMIHNPTTTTMINNSEQTNGMVQQQQSQDPNSQMMVDNSHVHPLAKTTSGGASPSSSSSSSRIPTTTTNYYTQSNDPMEIDNSHRHHSFNVSRHTERTGSDPTSDHYYRRQRESLSSFASNGPLHQDQQRKSTSHTISFGEAQPHHYHHEQLQSVLREIMVTGDDSDTLPPLKKT